MAKKAHLGFDMPVIFFDPFPPSEDVCTNLGATGCDTLEEVLSKADFVAVHCPGSKDNHHLLNGERIA